MNNETNEKKRKTLRELVTEKEPAMVVIDRKAICGTTPDYGMCNGLNEYRNDVKSELQDLNLPSVIGPHSAEGLDLIELVIPENSLFLYSMENIDYSHGLCYTHVLDNFSEGHRIVGEELPTGIPTASEPLYILTSPLGNYERPEELRVGHNGNYNGYLKAAEAYIKENNLPIEIIVAK